MKKLALLGASGHGKVVADAALASGWESVVFFDDAWPALQRNGDWSVAGDTKSLLLRCREFDGTVVAIGDCVARLEKHRLLQQAGAQLATIVHPHAVVSKRVRLGAGTVLLAGAIANIDSEIGEACILNTAATLDHDGFLADGVHLSPGVHLAGRVRVGACTWIGIGAVVLQSLTIGSCVMVGAGSVVVDPIADGLTVVGNPARRLNKRENSL